MVSANMLEGHSSKNHHRPREKGAECEWHGRKPLIFMRFHGVLLGDQHAMWPTQHNGKVTLVVLCHSGCPAWSTTGTNVSTTSPARDAAEETRPRNNARRQRKGSIRDRPLPLHVRYQRAWSG